MRRITYTLLANMTISFFHAKLFTCMKRLITLKLTVHINWFFDNNYTVTYMQLFSFNIMLSCI